MYLLALPIKRGSTNVGTPETSEISFEARPGSGYSDSSVQCVVRYCATFHFKSMQVNYARWQPQNS